MRRWARFASVGVIGFAFQLTLVHLLTSVVASTIALRSCSAVEAAILHNFVWHERWTWRDRVTGSSREAAYARLVKFNTASGLISIVGNVFFTALFVELAGAPVLAANVAAIVCLTMLNFLAADRLAFAPATRQRTRRIVAFLFAGSALHSGAAQAAELKPETVKAWEQYVKDVEARIRQEVDRTGPFLSVDLATAAQTRHLRSTVRGGEIVLEDVGDGTVDVGGGTISHWRGYLFVPGVSLEDCPRWCGGAWRRRQTSARGRPRVSGAQSRGRFTPLVPEGAANRDRHRRLQHRTFGELHATQPDTGHQSKRLDQDRRTEDVGRQTSVRSRSAQDRGFMWRLTPIGAMKRSRVVSSCSSTRSR